MHRYHLVLLCNAYGLIMLRRKPPINYLDLVPVRKVLEFTDTEERITLMIPKFKSPWMRTWLIPKSRSGYFRIHLDDMGSQVWRNIDGVRNAGEICSLISGLSAAAGPDPDNLEIRVTQFLSKLYKNRFILFKQIG
jgi:hypothetical protein